MSTRLSSTVLERSSIKLICRGSPSSYKLLSRIDESYFYSKINRAAFKRIKTVLEKRGELLSWRDLTLNDAVLPDEVKEALSSFKQKIIVNKVEEKKIYNQLLVYRKRRFIDAIGRHISEEQLKEGYDENKILEEISDRVAKARIQADMRKPLVMGVGANFKEVFEHIKNSDQLRAIPIGFPSWDNVNGGIPSNAVVLVMGYTGSMKSTLTDIIACNMAERGAKVGIISLEMTEAQILILRMARLSRIDRTEIRKRLNITEKQWRRMFRKLKELSERIKAAGGTIRVHTPDGMHKDEVYPSVQSHGYDVLIVDYPSLLKGIMDSRDFWRELMQFTSATKIFAKSKNTRVILLAQSDENDKLKLSSNMKNDADIALQIKHQENKDQSEVVEIETIKARDLTPVHMYLKREGKYANIEELSEEERGKIILENRNVKNDFKGSKGVKDSSVSTRSKTAEEAEIEQYFGDDELLLNDKD